MKMQRVGPEIKAIQDKYKKYKINDPRKAEMNQEVMAVYSREGINPVGGCFQMLVQMPIWFGLNRVLNSAIELRHAPWFGWIRDLSSRDPYFILPVVMFGVAHLYQGKSGSVGTGILGALFALVRIAYHSLLPVVIWHAVLDIVAGLAGARYFAGNPNQEVGLPRSG